MDNKKIIRLLTADEIEAKVNTVNQKGVALMLYKTARTDFTILDELYGPLGWQKRHWVDEAGFMWCEIAVRNSETGEWIKKSDVGTEDNNAKKDDGYKDGDSNLAYKTRVSDSVKRAGFAWGIGVELYTSPFIWIPADKCKITQNRQGKPACYDRFDVADIGYENRRISYLVIRNSQTGAVVYTYGRKPGQTAPATSGVSDEQRAWNTAMVDLRKSLKAHGVPEAFFLGACKKSSFEDMSLDGLKKAATESGMRQIMGVYMSHLIRKIEVPSDYVCKKTGKVPTEMTLEELTSTDWEAMKREWRDSLYSINMDESELEEALGCSRKDLLESVRAMLKKERIDEAWICGKYGVKSVEDLPDEALDRVNLITSLMELKKEFIQWQLDNSVDIDADVDVPFFTEEAS